MRIIKEISKQMQQDAVTWTRKNITKMCVVLVLVTFIATSTVGVIFLVVHLHGQGFLAFAAGFTIACTQIGAVMWVWHAHDKVYSRIKKQRADVMTSLTTSKESDEIR
jgi:uncharacterized membrane protein